MQSQEAQEQLDLIQRTIEQAKRSVHKGSGHFLIWGYLLAVAALLQYLSVSTGTAPEFHWLPWPAMALIGGILAGIYERSREAPRKEATDRIFAYLWGAFGVTLFLIIFSSVLVKQDPNPFVIILMGLPTFTSGGILRSRALMLGGASTWAIGAASAFFGLPETSLAFVLAVLLGFVIPGHVLRSQEKAEKA